MNAIANIRNAAGHNAAALAPLTGTQPAETFILILQDDRGLVYIDAVANANLQLNRMQGDGLLIADRRCEIRFSLHAREIALSLCQQFRDTRKIDQIAPWHAAEWEHVLTALDDWNLSTGRIQRSGDFLIGSQVTVSADKAAVGEIVGFRQHGRDRQARVHFAKPGARFGGVAFLSAYCPLGELKPLITSTAPVAA